jgi:hypothetical protein
MFEGLFSTNAPFSNLRHRTENAFPNGTPRTKLEDGL